MDDLLDRFRMLSAASRQPMEAVNVMLLCVRGAARPIDPDVGKVSQLKELLLNLVYLCLNALEVMDSSRELTV
jgi:hypothetical protein